jgi:hypothetical protein
MALISVALGVLLNAQSMDERVTVSLHCEPLPVALKTLFPAKTDPQFVIRGKTRDRKVSLFVNNRSRQEVLDKIAEILDLDIKPESSGDWSVREKPGFNTRESKVLGYHRVGFQNLMESSLSLANLRIQIGQEKITEQLNRLEEQANTIRETKPAGWQDALEAKSLEMEKLSIDRLYTEGDWLATQIGSLSRAQRMAIWNSNDLMAIYSQDGKSKAWLTHEALSGSSSLEVNTVRGAGLSFAAMGQSAPPGSFPEEFEDGFRPIRELEIKPYNQIWVPGVISPGDSDAAELLAISQDRPVVMEGLRSVSGDYRKIIAEKTEDREELRLRFKEQGDWVLLQAEDPELKRALDPEESLYRTVEQDPRPSFEAFSLLIHNSPSQMLNRMASGEVRGDLKLWSDGAERAGVGLWRALPGFARQQLEARRVVTVLELPPAIQPAVVDAIRFPGRLPESDVFQVRRAGEWTGFNALDSIYLEQSERRLNRASTNGVTVDGDVNDGVETTFSDDPEVARGVIFEGNWTLYLGSSAKDSLRWRWRYTRKKPFGKEPIPKSNEPLHRHGHGPSETDKPGFRAEPD